MALFVRLAWFLAGANPGAWIDNLSFAHADGSETTVEDEVIYSSGAPLEHADGDDDKRTVKDVFDTLNEEQKNVVYAMIAYALEDAKAGTAEHGQEAATIQEMFDALPEDQKASVYEAITHTVAPPRELSQT